MKLIHGALALVYFFFGMYVGFKCTRFDDMRDLLTACTTQNKVERQLINAYKEITKQSVTPFNHSVKGFKTK